VIAAGLTAAVYHGSGYLIGAIYGGAMKAYRAKHSPVIPKPPGWPATPARLNPRQSGHVPVPSGQLLATALQPTDPGRRYTRWFNAFLLS
jgi:hypothetical protein